MFFLLDQEVAHNQIGGFKNDILDEFPCMRRVTFALSTLSGNQLGNSYKEMCVVLDVIRCWHVDS